MRRLSRTEEQGKDITNVIDVNKSDDRTSYSRLREQTRGRRNKTYIFSSPDEMQKRREYSRNRLSSERVGAKS